MKKLFSITIIGIFFVSCSTNEQKHEKIVESVRKDSSNYTTVKWLDTLINLGTISSGDKKDIKFRFVNAGSKPLVIFDATASCGCTKPTFSSDAIAPGKEGFIAATFDSKRQCDSVIKNISVIANTKPDSVKVLTFTAKVINCESNDRVVVPHPTDGH